MIRGVQELLPELHGELVGIYAGRLRGAYLFGSYARDDFDQESDCDVLAVLDKFDSYGAEVDRTAECIARISLNQGISINLVFVTESDWRRGDSPFLACVREEARAI